jgi:hypothetical protein
MALKDTLIEQGPAGVTPYAAGANVAFGVALVRSAARTCKGSKDDNDDTILGFSVQPQNGVTLDEDGFYQASNDAGVPDIVRVARKGAIINALVIAKANTSIVDGDFLEAAPVGNAASYLGVLNEAGSNAGETMLTTVLAQALEDCTLTDASYKTPASNIEIGDKTATFSSANLTLLNLKEGDYILLEDVNGNGQLNRVKSLTSTVITMQLASTVQIVAATDLVYKVFQIKALVL